MADEPRRLPHGLLCSGRERAEGNCRDRPDSGIGAVVAVYQGCLLLVCQHREAVDEITWELPGGTVKPGEERKLAVKRELEEEAGVLCKDLSYMGALIRWLLWPTGTFIIISPTI